MGEGDAKADSMRGAGRAAWPRTPAEAIELQKAMAGEVAVQPLTNPARIVAAIDLSPIGPARRWTKQAAGIIVYDLDEMREIERHAIVRPIIFPYIPGLLSFREAPAAMEVIERAKTPVDVYLIDGQGLAHPRRMGVACHIGVLIRRPTIGCAKSKLVGEPKESLGVRRGSRVHLYHRGQVVGSLLRTRDNVKPLYVSVGNLITLEECVDSVLRLADRYRLPEPARLAHNYVTLVARGAARSEDCSGKE